MKKILAVAVLATNLSACVYPRYPAPVYHNEPYTHTVPVYRAFEEPAKREMDALIWCIQTKSNSPICQYLKGAR